MNEIARSVARLNTFWIYQDMHWTSDCVLGGAIGYFIDDSVVDLHEKNDSRLRVSSIFISFGERYLTIESPKYLMKKITKS